jgi:ketosteroid isomerase-like protein
MGRQRHNLRTELSMDELTAVRGAVDRLVAGALGPLIDLLAEDVEFEVASGGDVPRCRKDSGQQAVLDYFAALGDLPAFWRMDYSAAGGRVIAWGDESFTLKGCELEGGLEFALVLDLHHGMVTRLLVIEDLSFIPGWDFPGASAAAVPAVPAGARRRRALRDAAATATLAWWGRSAVAVADARSEHVIAGAPA